MWLKTFWGVEGITAKYIRIEKDNMPKLYMKTGWTPPGAEIPDEVHDRISNFRKALAPLFTKRPGQPNLLPFQQKILRQIRQDDSILIVNADKGLGPCGVTYKQYVNDALVHLTNEKTYVQLSIEDALVAAFKTKQLIHDFCNTHLNKGLNHNDATYIRKSLAENTDPFGFFYLMYKIHKPGRTTRPVCSDCSSLLHGLGKWITTELNPIAQRQQSYFQNSFALKEMLDDMEVPPNTKIFSCDAKSMYTNIPTEPALEVVGLYLRAHCNSKLAEALIDALTIVMKNNIVQFGDTFWKQISGTAMGISPAPPWAILFFAIHELYFVEKWKESLIFWKRFIDDGLGLWKLHADTATNNALWTEFQSDINNFHGLEWDFTPLADSVDFMDMTLSIANNNLTSHSSKSH